jgi:8-oxo-dGTP pyrophosphatase MutT (NUDIX family)
VDTDDGQEEATRWKVHDERVVDNTRRLRLSIAHIELPDGVHFEQYVLRMPRAAMTIVVDDSSQNVLMIWRHRFIVDRWTWEIPGGYVDPNEDPLIAAAREVAEETGWRPRGMRLLGSFQPLVGSADFENLLYVAEGAENTGKSADVNEAARIEWIPLNSVRELMGEGKIIGAATQIGLLHLLANRSSGAP